MSNLEVTGFLLVYIVLPVVAIVALIFLIVLLNRATKTVEHYDEVASKIEKKLEVLDGPINALNKAQESVNKVMSFFKR